MKILVVLLMLLPAASAIPGGSLFVSWDGLETMEIRIEAVSQGAEAAMLRQAADADGDGNVSTEEANETAHRQWTQVQGIALGTPLGRVYLDSHEGTNSTVERIEPAGLSGPVNATGAVTMTWWMTLDFAPPTGDVFQVALDVQNRSASGFVRMAPDYVEVRSPEGHSVNGTGNLPFGAKHDTSCQCIRFPGGIPSTGNPIIIEYAPAAEAPAATTEAPAIAPMLALAGILLLASVRRLRG